MGALISSIGFILLIIKLIRIISKDNGLNFLDIKELFVYTLIMLSPLLFVYLMWSINNRRFVQLFVKLAIAYIAYNIIKDNMD